MGGINGIFEPLTNVFKISKYVFEAILGSLSLIASLSYYLALVWYYLRWHARLYLTLF